MPSIAIRDVVRYVDRTGKSHLSLVTAVHGNAEWDDDDHRVHPPPSVNIVFVTEDESRIDQYGRQLERETSVVHCLQQGAQAFYWVLPAA